MHLILETCLSHVGRRSGGSSKHYLRVVKAEVVYPVPVDQLTSILISGSELLVQSLSFVEFIGDFIELRPLRQPLDEVVF